MSGKLPAQLEDAASEMLDAIKSIPGAAKAIAHLVKGGAAAGAAWLDIVQAEGERRAQGIRDDTAAKSVFTKAVAKAAAQKAIADTSVLERAIPRLMSNLVQEQENVERIAKLTIEHLEAERPPNPESQPDEDWLNLFSSFASRANSETLRGHWSQILAGEIRKPGSFSLSTLQVMSVLDPNLARVIERIWPAVFDKGYVTTLGRFNDSPFYADLVTLDAIGLLRLGHGARFNSDARGRFGFAFVDKAVGFECNPNQAYHIPVAILTQAGRELSSIVSVKDSEELIKEIALLVKNHIQARVAYIAGYDPKTKTVVPPETEIV